MTPRTYPTPEAFRQALEQRLRSTTASGNAFARRRQLLAFERFLARIDAECGDRATLKGGLVLEYRLARARTTRDVDLRMVGAVDDVVARLQQACARDLGDHMTFTVRVDDAHPAIVGDGIRYDGRRFVASCFIAGKPWAFPFGVDVALGDPIFGPPEVRFAHDALAFAGVAPPLLRLYPVETHIAEKLHAYTLPRARPNSRVKDLPDIALLATTKALDGDDVRAAIEQTFAFRGSHSIPESLPAPPSTWAAPYARMAAEDGLAWTTLDEVTAAARAFLEPVLAGQQAAQWDPTAFRWLHR